MTRLIFSPRSGYIRPGEALVSGRRDVDPTNEGEDDTVDILRRSEGMGGPTSSIREAWARRQRRPKHGESAVDGDLRLGCGAGEVPRSMCGSEGGEPAS